MVSRVTGSSGQATRPTTARMISTKGRSISSSAVAPAVVERTSSMSRKVACQ